MYIHTSPGVTDHFPKFEEMRNATMLRHLLRQYTMALDMADDGLFRLTLVNKQNDSMATFEGKSFSVVLRLAQSHMQKEFKE